MAPLAVRLATWRREHPNQLPMVALTLLVLGGSLWVGVRSKATATQLATKRPEWQRTADHLATARQQFRVPTSSESAALSAESGRMGALGVPPGDRVALMELVSQIADAAALTDVHVNFRAGVDSAFIPPRSIAGAVVNPAAYSIVVDFSGSFAGVVQFVSNLPPSVSVSRLGAARRGDRAAYHILLSVYELPNGDSAS
jgi:hypothetical protein